MTYNFGVQVRTSPYRTETRVMRCAGFTPEHRKMILREAALIAAQFEIVSYFKKPKGQRSKSFKVDHVALAKRFAGLESKAATEGGQWVGIVHSLNKFWRYQIKRANRLKINPILEISMKQLLTLRSAEQAS